MARPVIFWERTRCHRRLSSFSFHPLDNRPSWLRCCVFNPPPHDHHHYLFSSPTITPHHHLHHPVIERLRPITHPNHSPTRPSSSSSWPLNCPLFGERGMGREEIYIRQHAARLWKGPLGGGRGGWRKIHGLITGHRQLEGPATGSVRLAVASQKHHPLPPCLSPAAAKPQLPSGIAADSLDANGGGSGEFGGVSGMRGGHSAPDCRFCLLLSIVAKFIAGGGATFIGFCAVVGA